jgi:hypothetical protein
LTTEAVESHTYDTGKEHGANGHKMAVLANPPRREIRLVDGCLNKIYYLRNTVLRK